MKLVADAIDSMITRQMAAQINTINTDRTTYSRIYYDNPIFSKLVGIFSTFAIKKAQEQFKRITPNMSPCTRTFTRISGLPYKHFLYEHITAYPNWKLDEYNFHKYWFYIIDDSATNNVIQAPIMYQMREPDTQPRHGTRKPAMPGSSTQRGMTKAEIQDIRLAKQRRQQQRSHQQ